MSIINRSELKKIVGDFKISNDFYPVLSEKTEELIRKAMERAKQNQRRTLMSRDL